MSIRSWSTTAASNNASPPNGAPEGMAPSTVNDTMRQMMADVRSQCESLEWFDYGDTPTYISTTGFTVPTDKTAIYMVGRRIRCNDATTLYGTITATSYSAGPNTTTVTVLLDSGSLSASITYIAVGILTFSHISIPPSALKRKSITRNGAMDIWQRGTTFTSPANGSVLADRWLYSHTSAGAATFSRSTTVPTSAQAKMLFNYSFKFACTTADAAVAAGDAEFIYQYVEGYDVAKHVGKTITRSFWVYATKTGINCVAFRNSANDRSYVAEYTINNTLTWEFKTVHIPLDYSGGTWDYTSGVGLSTAFTLMAGSTFHTAAGSWQNGNYIATSNQVNHMDTIGNVFHVVGVQDEEGPIATDFEYRPFHEELALCQRDYWKTFPYATAPAQNAGVTGAILYIANKAGALSESCPTMNFPVAMRTAPTLTYYNPSAANANIRDVTAAADGGAATTGAVSDANFWLYGTGNAATAVGNLIQIHATAATGW